MKFYSLSSSIAFGSDSLSCFRPRSYRNWNVLNLWSCHIVIQTDIVLCKLVEILDVRIQPEGRCLMLFPCNKLLYQGNKSVINVGICNHMYQLAHFHITHLCQHMHKHCVLANIPVVGRQNILGALIQNGI